MSHVKQNKTEQRCGVPFEVRQVVASPTGSHNVYVSMNLFFRFAKRVTEISVQSMCCNDSAELRYQTDRYSTIRNYVEFRALAVRHGGLNGYQGQ